jgi:hypothetical protein
MFYVSLSFHYSYHSHPCIFRSEDLLRKENAGPTKAQRPPPPRNIISPPPVSI